VKEIITLEAYTQDPQTKVDRRTAFPEDWTKEVEENAKKLLKKVNELLAELNVEKVTVSSGFRPADVNKQVANAAKRSYHMNGYAIDILDDQYQTLGKLIAGKPELLKKYELWIEDLTSTKGKHTNWVHLDYGIRSDRPSRMFKP